MFPHRRSLGEHDDQSHEVWLCKNESSAVEVSVCYLSSLLSTVQSLPTPDDVYRINTPHYWFPLATSNYGYLKSFSNLWLAQLSQRHLLSIYIQWVMYMLCNVSSIIRPVDYLYVYIGDWIHEKGFIHSSYFVTLKRHNFIYKWAIRPNISVL